MFKVSIITPVYNRPEYLEEAVISVQQQTYTNWEHIIVDDGATNLLTQEILKKIASYPKVTILRKENGGLGAARNFGIERCSGQFVLTLDDDDKWRADFIEIALAIFGQDDRVGAVTSWMQEFGHRKNLVKPLGGETGSFLVHNNSVHGMFRKKDWLAIGKYDESLFFQPYTDWDFWLRLTANHKSIKVIEEICFYYRTHKNSSMLKDSEDKHIDLFRFLIEKNKDIYAAHVADALCLLESKLLIAKKNSETRNVIKRWVGKLNLQKK
jgi:glycosyltransferase involved in cell wall biosynthesis